MSATVSACTPALEEPSPVKVATPRADEQLNYVPSYIDCLSPPQRHPYTVSLNCARTDSYLSDITWEEWLSDSARGTATRIFPQTNRAGRSGAPVERNDKRGRKDSDASSTVTVTLSRPVHTAFGLVFTELRVNDTLVSP